MAGACSDQYTEDVRASGADFRNLRCSAHGDREENTTRQRHHYFKLTHYPETAPQLVGVTCVNWITSTSDFETAVSFDGRLDSGGLRGESDGFAAGISKRAMAVAEGRADPEDLCGC
jgi:hypothetical protein